MRSFPLRRLPILAISEVIKSMNIREIYLFSLASKKSQNIVMFSIPKNSLSTNFIFKRNGFRLELMPKGFEKKTADLLAIIPYTTEKRCVFPEFSTCGLYVQSECCNFYKVEDFTRKLFYRYSKTFRNTKISIKFEDSSIEELAMEMIKFAWNNGIPLDHIDFWSKNCSSESIQTLLNECHEHHTSLEIRAKVPKGFKYTPPPGGYKFESLTVEHAHWVNLADFLQCQRLFLLEMSLDLTVEYLNGLLKKVVNLESRIESFSFELKSIKPSDFAEVVKGLSESAIIQSKNETCQGLRFERKDGLKMLVFHFDGCIYLAED